MGPTSKGSGGKGGKKGEERRERIVRGLLPPASRGS